MQTMTDANGEVTTNTFDGSGRVIRQSDPMQRVTTFDYSVANGDQGADQSKRRHAADAAIDGGVELAEFFRHLGSSTDASEGFRADQERRAPSWRT